MRALLIVSVVAALLGACGHKAPYSDRLLSIEKMAVDQPMEALRQLDSTSASLSTAADSALHALAYSEAARCLGLKLYSEDYIRPALTLFEADGDRKRAVRAELMYALSLFDAGKPVVATANLKQTEADMLRISGNDHRRLGWLYMALAQANALAGHSQLATDYYNKAARQSSAAGDAYTEMLSRYRLAILYYRERRSGALDSLVLCMRSVPTADNTMPRAMVATADGMASLLRGDSLRAIHCLQEAQPLDPDRIAALVGGDLMAKFGRMAEAEVCWYDAANSIDNRVCTQALQRLAQQADSSGGEQRQLFLSQLLNHRYAASLPTDSAARIVGVQQTFDAQLSAAASRHRIFSLSAIIGLLLAMAAAALAVLRRRKLRRQQAQQAWDIEKELLHCPAVDAFHQLSRRGRPAADDDWGQLEQLVTARDKHLDALLAAHRSLSATERRLVVLIRLRFQPAEAGALLAMSPQSVTNMRVRLLPKLFGDKGGAREFDRRIHSL